MAWPDADIYAATPEEQVAINLFYGWGYNFYRRENQLRADDLLVRHQVAAILGDARIALGNAEAAYRQAHLPPLSREYPRPDPAALGELRVLESLAAQVGAVASRVRSLPVPEDDRISQRHRQEADTLVRLLRADMALVGHAEALSRSLREQTPSGIVQQADDLRGHVTVIETALRDRQAILNLVL